MGFTNLNTHYGKESGRVKYAKSSQKGITLVALVVTVVVLLILAGVSIGVLFNNGGLFSKGEKAAEQTNISTLEERANLIYSDLIMEKYANKLDKDVTMQNVVDKLSKEGYTIDTRTTSGNVVTGITLDKSSIILAPNGDGTINVTLKRDTESGVKYYVKIDGKYYEMKLENGGIIIARNESTPEGEQTSSNVTASSSDASIVTAEANGNIVTVRAVEGVNSGTANITVTYGIYSKPCTVKIEVRPIEGMAPVEGTDITTTYGKIDVIWLKANNEVSETPNAPDYYNGDLQPVTWTKSGTTWTEDTTAKATSYNYREGTGTEDNLSSEWANAKNTRDGSYFVWIPRYAYRITYYANDPTVEANKDQEPTGYYDGYGMWKKENGQLKCALEDGIEIVEHEGDKYIVHPAFGTTKTGAEDKKANIEVGGWDKALSGFWVAKYEMSKEVKSGEIWEFQETTTYSGTGNNNGNVVADNTGIRAVSKAGKVGNTATDITSWRYIKIGNCYTNGFNYDRNKESHLIKNSEWGACTYLTLSQYGRNGHEVDTNNSSSFVTGNGGGSTNASQTSGMANAYNTELGAKASTTGNIYGIYDMSGGAKEYTANFNNTDEVGYFASQGWDNLKTTNNSTKYATKYNNTQEKYYGVVDEIAKTGDGIKEFKVTDERLWFEDMANLTGAKLPFFARGGEATYSMPELNGIFASNAASGSQKYTNSFRIVI